jgi:hypothetical protein
MVSEQCGTIRKATARDNEIVENERRRTLCPEQIRQSVFLQRFPRPDQLASDGVEAIKNAGGAQRVNAAASNGGSRARPVTSQAFAETNKVGMRPENEARGQFVADHQFLFAALLLRDSARTGDRKSRPSQSDGLPPKCLGQVSAPVAFQSNVLHNAATVASKKSRKVGRGIEGREVGRAADCFKVTNVAILLRGPFPNDLENPGSVSHAVEAHKQRQSSHEKDKHAESGETCSPTKPTEKNEPNDRQQKAGADRHESLHVLEVPFEVARRAKPHKIDRG